MANYSLTANPNHHYYTTRRSRILGIVLHVTAGLEDFAPPDSGAESTIRYGQSNTRPASWHGIVDSDSVIDSLPDSYTAFHVIGYNAATLGLEIANRDARWTGKPDWWVDATLRNAAAWCRPRVEKYELPVQLADKAQVDAAIRAGRPFGFTYHRYLDPTRRVDPGFDFPWNKFAGYVRGEPATAALRARGPFPLPDGHWFGPDDGTAASHSGRRSRDDIGVQQIQAETGADIDGVYGSGTQEKVRAWQVARGLPATGLVDAATWAVMISNGAPTAPAATGSASHAATPDTPAAPAAALRVKGPFPLPAGHYYGEVSASPRAHSGYWQRDREAVRQIQAEAGTTVDGRYGPGTTKAVRAWQTRHSLDPDGLVGAATWAAFLQH